MIKNKKTVIALAKSAGFCFGVKRAINMALRAAQEHSNIEMLGDIVHNHDVVKEIKRAGIKKVKSLSTGKNKILLIRAHGIPLNLLHKAQQLGYEIMDATCPMVYEIHKIAASMEEKGRKIIIIGDKNHAEVKGIVGQLKKKPLVINGLKNIPRTKLKKITRGCVVVQSTQNVDVTEKIFSYLKKIIKDLKVFNTICATTRKKQQEIRIMPEEFEVMIIIGSLGSANTKRLYEISKSLNKRTYWVENARELKKGWFKNISRIGVTAGASTPDYTTKQVINQLAALLSNKSA